MMEVGIVVGVTESVKWMRLDSGTAIRHSWNYVT